MGEDLLAWIQIIDFFAAFAIGLAATGISLLFVRRFAVIDAGGGRRTHTLATPRAGAIGIAIAFALLILLNSSFGAAIWLIPAMALLGLLDDFLPQPAWLRLVLQIALSLAAVIQLGDIFDYGPIVFTRVAFALMSVWLVNAANFFDGRNGLLSGNFILLLLALPLIGIDWPLAVIAAGLWLGFLPYNFPRAKLFMGDVGSYFVGGTLAWIFLQAAYHSPERAFVFLIACSGMLADPFLTLALRAFAGKAIWRAHREHLYQFLARTGTADWKLLLVYLLYSLVSIGVARALLTQVGARFWLSGLLWMCLSAVLWRSWRRRILRARRQAKVAIAPRNLVVASDLDLKETA
jgi:UDP-N-acetylmuramyl pentapeptide phosphotransferase/UDP-N-acetylglucosamine-1-phosphate transferase